MKRTRKRAFSLSAGLLTAALAVGVMAPASAAQDEKLPRTDEVAAELFVNHECEFTVDITGELLYEYEYERADRKYVKQVQTFRTLYSFEKEQYIPGVDEYQYKKERYFPAEGYTDKKWEKVTPQYEDVTEYRWHRAWADPKQVKGYEHTGNGNNGGWQSRNPNHWFDVPAHLDPASALDVGMTGNVPLSVYGWVPSRTAPTVPYRYQQGEQYWPSADGYAKTLEGAPQGSWGPPVAERTVQNELDPIVEHEWSKTKPGDGWTYTGESNWVETKAAEWKLTNPGLWPGWVGSEKSTDEFTSGGVTYRYKLVDTRTKAGTDVWVKSPRYLQPAPSFTEPSTDEFTRGGVTYRYTNVTTREIFTGWKSLKHSSGWLNEGDAIPTGIPSIGDVEPGEAFEVGSKTYRYNAKPWKFRDATTWSIEHPGGDWQPTGESILVDDAPNAVKVSINDDTIVDQSFGEEYSASFGLEDGDTYVVQYKHHGDEDWTIDQAGVASCQPEVLVTYSEWEDGTWECDDTTVEQTRTETTTSYIWDAEEQEWVLDTENATTVEQTQTRELTEGEFEACVEVEDEVLEREPETEPETETEVESVSVEKQIETKVLAETQQLPRTGASTIALLIAGLLALFTGAGTLVTRRKR